MMEDHEKKQEWNDYGPVRTSEGHGNQLKSRLET